MDQIKRKFVSAKYNLVSFNEEMLLLFSNAKTYNPEGSWVHSAAQTMEDYFVKRYAEETANLPITGDGGASSGAGAGAGGFAKSAMAGIKREESISLGDGTATSTVQSGTSTPMFKGPATTKIPPRIKINVGASRRREQVVPSESVSASVSASPEGSGMGSNGNGNGNGGESDEGDDDY